MELEVPFRGITLILIFEVFSSMVGTISSCTTSVSAPSTALHNCTFATKHDSEHFEVLAPLVGQIFSADKKDVAQDRTYTYLVGICTQPCSHFDFDCDKNAGVVQTWKEKGKTQTRVAGRFNDTVIQGSSRWKMLTYNSGDKYKNHCKNHKERRANIMLTCDENAEPPTLTVLEENNQRDDSCYYLLQISGRFLCPKRWLSKVLPKFAEGASPGSVILIIAAVGVSCYLIFGCLYRRVVVGAKGIDQVPNLQSWQNFGNLMADGCDYAFRTKATSNARSSHTAPGSGGGYEPVTSSPGNRVYKGLGDDILSNSESDAADDSLLPM